MKSKNKSNDHVPSNVKAYKFYQALGHLFYAVASADKVVVPKEVETLKNMITKNWLATPQETEAAIQIQITFDKLLHTKVSSEAAFSVFKDYKTINSHLFNDKRKEQIWTTVNSIAESINGKNKSELVLLSKLSVLLKV